MSSVNKVILIGNVGKDPETRSFQNGGKVASFSVATSDRWKDKATGEQKERTEWNRISVLNEHLVSFAEAYVKKGAKVYIEGQLETRKWTDKDGAEKYTTEVVLRPYRGEIRLLDSAKKDGSPSHEEPTLALAKAGSSSTADFLDDEIPPF